MFQPSTKLNSHLPNLFELRAESEGQIQFKQLTLCTAALLPKLNASSLFPVCQYWPNLINSGVTDLCSHGNNNQTHLN